MEVTDKHAWYAVFCSLPRRCGWKCIHCGRITYGSFGSFPGYGESPEFFKCMKPTRVVTFSDNLKAVKVKEMQHEA